MGHLIPAGTGFHQHRDTEIEFTVEEPEPKQDEPAEGDESAVEEDEVTCCRGGAAASGQPGSAGEESA